MAELPNWMGGPSKRQKINARSKKQESDRAKEIGGRTQAGSGSSWRAAGDVKTAEVLEELKFTDRASFSLKVADWRSIARKASTQGRTPRMVIEFPEHGLRLIVEEG